MRAVAMLRWWSMLAALCACNVAAALCPPPEVISHRYVGDTNPLSLTYDAQCTDNDIQSAINNATCPNTTIVITSEHTYTAQHLEINGKDLTLEGTTLNCGPPGACGDACPPPPT